MRVGVPTHQRWSTSQRSSSTPAAAHQTPYIFSPLSHLLCQIVVCCPGCLVFPSSVLFVFAWVVHSRFVTALRVRSGFVTALQDSSSQHSSDLRSPFATILVLWTCTYLPHWRFNKEHLLAYCFRVSVMTLASQQSRSALPAVPTRFITLLSLKDVQFSFLFFLYYAYPIILNDRLCRIYLFFLCCTFHCVNSKMLNEFSVLTRLIK